MYKTEIKMPIYIEDPNTGEIHIAGISTCGDPSTVCGLFLIDAHQGGLDGELGNNYKTLKRATPTCPQCLGVIRQILNLANIQTLRRWTK